MCHPEVALFVGRERPVLSNLLRLLVREGMRIVQLAEPEAAKEYLQSGQARVALIVANFSNCCGATRQFVEFAHKGDGPSPIIAYADRWDQEAYEEAIRSPARVVLTSAAKTPQIHVAFRRAVPARRSRQISQQLRSG